MSEIKNQANRKQKKNLKMDEYEKKLKELRTYVPFLTKMIDKLEKAGDKSKEAQVWILRFRFSLIPLPVKFSLTRESEC